MMQSQPPQSVYATHLVHLTVDRATATITLDSPTIRNALPARVRTGLSSALTEAMADDKVRAIVLTGTGPVFCSGMDLKEVGAALRGETIEPAPELPDIFEQIMGGPKPVVAVLRSEERPGGKEQPT